MFRLAVSMALFLIVSPSIKAQEKVESPLGPPVEFGHVIAVEKGNLVVERLVPITKIVIEERTTVVNGKEVVENREVPVTEFGLTRMKLDPKGIRLVTIEGKPVELAKGVGKIVILAGPEGVHAKYKPLFAKDTLTLVFKDMDE